ncbi:DoxX family protein [Paracoccus pacificus]|uniref:DoxX family protein n=1 Tax=Paracoccus pacificus TaxID=1463598 RepID=A0ABW4R428_9RHOB
MSTETLTEGAGVTTSTSNDRLAMTLLRVVTGLLLVPHGAQKLFGLFGGGIEGTTTFLANSGYPMPQIAAIAIGTLEFFGGLALAAGFLTRPIAIAVVIFMLFAIRFHLPNGFFWIKGGFEVPVLWGTAALVLALRGGGPWSVDALLFGKR